MKSYSIPSHCADLRCDSTRWWHRHSATSAEQEVRPNPFASARVHTVVVEEKERPSRSRASAQAAAPSAAAASAALTKPAALSALAAGAMPVFTTWASTATSAGAGADGKLGDATIAADKIPPAAAGAPGGGKRVHVTCPRRRRTPCAKLRLRFQQAMHRPSFGRTCGTSESAHSQNPEHCTHFLP